MSIIIGRAVCAAVFALASAGYISCSRDRGQREPVVDTNLTYCIYHTCIYSITVQVENDDLKMHMNIVIHANAKSSGSHRNFDVKEITILKMLCTFQRYVF